MLRKCPHHRIGKGQQIQYFCAGLLPTFKSMIDSLSNGSLSTKTVVEALNLFERVATTTAMWPSDRVVHKRTAGVHEIDTFTALFVKIDSLVHKVESMSHSANAVQIKKSTYEECRASHITSECPILSLQPEPVDYIQGGQHQQNNPYFNTYNLGWRNHPIFSWRDNQNNIRPRFQQPEKSRSPGTLPSNTDVNPKEHVKAITTRSRVQLPEVHVKRSVANKEMIPSTDDEHVEQTEQTTAIKKSSGTSQVKETVPITA
ncbi:uncharacterized protein Adt_39967 [Abeliophyllum distichum]|uniref:Uncharacterized protein n=1 Tax=Abeliophyllum distichum TaxID=126358 RepID=A0ABD1Q6J9_9LAMI